MTGALQVLTPDQYPLQWATTEGNLGEAYRVRMAGEPADNTEQALACFEGTLQVYTREAFPAQWANMQNNLGVAYGDRIRGDRADNLERGIAYYTAALEVYTRDEAPVQLGDDAQQSRYRLPQSYQGQLGGEPGAGRWPAIVMRSRCGRARRCPTIGR